MNLELHEVKKRVHQCPSGFHRKFTYGLFRGMEPCFLTTSNVTQQPRAFLPCDRHRSSGQFKLRHSQHHLGPFYEGLALNKELAIHPKNDMRKIVRIKDNPAFKDTELDFLETQGFTQAYNFISSHFITCEVFKDIFFTIKSRWMDLQIQNHPWHAWLLTFTYLVWA